MLALSELDLFQYTILPIEGTKLAKLTLMVGFLALDHTWLHSLDVSPQVHCWYHFCLCLSGVHVLVSEGKLITLAKL